MARPSGDLQVRSGWAYSGNVLFAGIVQGGDQFYDLVAAAAGTLNDPGTVATWPTHGTHGKGFNSPEASDAGIDHGDPSGIGGTGATSVIVLYNPDGAGVATTGKFVVKTGGGNDFCSLERLNNETYRGFISVGSDNATSQEAAATWANGTVNLLGIHHDGSNQYVRKDSFKSGNAAKSGNSNDTNQTLWVGNDGAGSGCAGTIYYVLILDTDVSDAEWSNLETDPWTWSESTSSGPALTSPSATDIQGTTVDLNVTTDVGSGTLYWYISTSATAPSATDLKNGTGATASGNQAVSATGAQLVNNAGTLSSETQYYGYLLHNDGSNDSNIAETGAFTTADVTAPVLSSPSTSDVQSTTVDINVTTDEDNGTLYWYISASATPPSIADHKDGTGAVAFGNQSVSGTGAQLVNNAGALSASTSYYAHLLQTDAASNDSNQATTAQFTTNSAGRTATAQDTTLTPGQTVTVDLTGFSGAPTSATFNGVGVTISNATQTSVDVTMPGLSAFALGQGHAATRWNANYDLVVSEAGGSGTDQAQIVPPDTDGPTYFFGQAGVTPYPADTVWPGVTAQNDDYFIEHISGGAVTLESDAGVVSVASTPSTFEVRVFDVSANAWTAIESWTYSGEESPDPFTFNDQSNVAPSVANVTSNTITVSGLSGSVAAAVSGDASAEYSKNGGAWTSTAGTAENGDTFAVRVDASGSFSTTVSAVLTIGGESDSFDVTTRAEDTAPDQFAFTDQTVAASTADVESGAVTITGMDNGQNATFSGDTGSFEMSINGGAWQAVATTLINPGDTLNLRADAPAIDGNSVSLTVTISGVSDTYTVTASSIAVWPSTIGYRADIRAINDIRTDISESGSVRGVDLSAENVYSITLKTGLLTDTELSTLMSFYDDNKGKRIEIDPPRDPYSYLCLFTKEPDRDVVSGTYSEATVRLEGNRKV